MKKKQSNGMFRMQIMGIGSRAWWWGW